MTKRWTSENFRQYDAEHPEIYRLFCKFALQAAARRPFYSAKAIFHRIRWETMVTSGEDFKIDDGWISHYARKFMQEHPKYSEFFQTRVRRGGYHITQRRQEITFQEPLI